ncbi:hypothetical protein OQA88_12824 [Cercophora sp. LCS_1]
MAPLLLHLLSRFDPSVATDEIREQWELPGDVFSVLLILGGDVVARALAQLAGRGFTPVAFSFGWVAYSVSALVSTFGENRLMPQTPDCRCKVINGKSGYVRENSSWVLGRVMRDFESWKDDAIKQKTERLMNDKWEAMQKDARKEDPSAKVKRPRRGGLVVSFYEPSKTRDAGVPTPDYVYWSGVVTVVLQLGIAAIPCGIDGHWGILLITVSGTMLSFMTGLLPQWSKEKWACRRNAKENYVITRGNGAQHAIVVLGNRKGLNFEDLAAGQENVEVTANTFTRVVLSLLAALWILLLITSAGIKTNTWYLLAVGAIGMVQNIFAAGWNRRPENMGIPLDFIDVVGCPKVMDTLVEVENRVPWLGRSMRDEFFPGELNEKEEEIWAELEKKAREVDNPVSRKTTMYSRA